MIGKKNITGKSDEPNLEHLILDTRLQAAMRKQKFYQTRIGHRRSWSMGFYSVLRSAAGETLDPVEQLSMYQAMSRLAGPDRIDWQAFRTDAPDMDSLWKEVCNLQRRLAVQDDATREQIVGKLWASALRIAHSDGLVDNEELRVLMRLGRLLGIADRSAVKATL